MNIHRIPTWIFVIAISTLAVATPAFALADEAGEVKRSDEFQRGDVVVVTADEAKFYVAGKEFAALPKGTKVDVLEVRGAWIGASISVEGKKHSGWVLLRHIGPIARPEKSPPQPPAPSEKSTPQPPTPSEKSAPQPPVPSEKTPPQPVTKSTAVPPAKPKSAAPAKIEPPIPLPVDAETAVAALRSFGVRMDENADKQITLADASHSTITDRTLAYVTALPKLAELELGSTAVTDAGLVHLKQMTGLTTLYVNDTVVTDAGLQHLQDLTNLEALGLNNTKVTGPGLAHLKRLTKLRVLNLSQLPITDDALVHLKGFTQLETLALEGTKVTGPGFVNLEQMTNLITLNLKESAVTDELFPHLRGLEKLRLLHVHKTQVTDEAADRFDDELPGLAVFR